MIQSALASVFSNLGTPWTSLKTDVRQFLRAEKQTETERGDHDFCRSRSHYTDIDTTISEGTPGSQSGDRTHGPLTRSRVLNRPG